VEQDFSVTRRVHGLERSRLLRRQPARFVLPDNAPERAEDDVGVLKQLLQAPEPPISTLGELQDLIDDGSFGVLHFACHAGFERDDRGPRVHLDLPFLPRELVDAGSTWQAPLIFLNACRSAGPRYQCIGIDSFAELFLRANAGAFIGSLWELRDGTALEFARQLYTSLLSGQELGKAVTELRRNAREDGDPTWLAYAVYGHPQAKMV
jgi:CHAT domain-containing protein